MVIRKYSQFISESNKTSVVGKSNEMALLENEYLRMKSEGLSESEINENIFCDWARENIII